MRFHLKLGIFALLLPIYKATCHMKFLKYNILIFLQAIILLSNCLKQRKNVGKSNDKISSAIHTQLGNHQIQLSKKLKDGGKKDESKMTAQEAAEVN